MRSRLRTIRQFLLSLLMAAIFLLWNCIVTSDARADLITFGFTANVVSVNDRLSSTFNTSQTLSGSLTYEPSTPDLMPLDPINGRYEGAIKALTFTVGQYTGTFSGRDVIFVSSAHFILQGSSFSGENVAGTRPADFKLGLFKDNAFPTDALPLVLPSDLREQGILQFFDSTAFPPVFTVAANITSVTMIPEPASLLLISSGLLGLIFWR
jgi:hypothetical protein